MRACRWCRTAHGGCCPRNPEARQAGECDGRAGGRSLLASVWPPGIWGHADYEAGYWAEREEAAE